MEQRDQEIVDRIASIRMRNNVQWMRILEIALDSNPEETKRVLKDINANDGIISELLRDLTKW